MKNAAMVLLIIRSVLSCFTGIGIITLLWRIPMILKINRSMTGEYMSTGFKVAVLIFGAIIPGILLLCD